MTDVVIPGERDRDPWEKNAPGLGLGRDPKRTLMQWDGGPNAFSPSSCGCLGRRSLPNRAVPLDPFWTGAAHIVQLRPITRDQTTHESPNERQDVHPPTPPERSPSALLATTWDECKE